MLFWRTRFQLLDPEEAARILDVPSNTLAHWRCSNRGPTFIRLGRRVKYDIHDIYTFIESQRRPTNDHAPGSAICGKRPARLPDGEHLR